MIHGASATDTSLRVRAACYDCGADLDQDYTVDALAEMTTPPRCGKHQRRLNLQTRKHALHELLMAGELDETTDLLVRVAFDVVRDQLEAARAKDGA